MSSPGTPHSEELPAVDDRLVGSETRFEIDDGQLVYVPPAHEPHASAQSAVDALLRAHRAPDFAVAVEMLTRTSIDNDFAPDVSVYPSARDPKTGGRQLEQLAFEIVSTERLANAASKAAKLTKRGVRRVFAIDIARSRVFEWSAELGTWSFLAPDDVITDLALAVPLPVATLLDTVLADDAVVRAYRAQRHPEFLAERRDGQVDMLRAMLVDKFGVIEPTLDDRLAAATLEDLERYRANFATAPTLAAVFD